MTQDTAALDSCRVNEILRDDPTHMFQLDDLVQVNLLDIQVPSNGGQDRGFLVQHSKNPKDYFRICEPYTLSATFDLAHWKKLEELLGKTSWTYKVTYYGPHYWKDSHGKRSIGLELDLWYLPRSTRMYLRDFGLSYGKIEINGTLCDLSHSGGTWDIKEGTWCDFTHGWHLIGQKTSFPAITSLIGGQA